MSKSDDLAMPIIEKVGDDEVSFLRLDMDDIEKWGNEIGQRRKIDARKRIALDKTLNPMQSQQLLHMVENEEIEHGQILARSYTPKGIKKVLMESLKKSGIDEVAAAATIKLIHHSRQADLARKIISPPDPALTDLASGAVADPTEGEPAAEADATSSPSELA